MQVSKPKVSLANNAVNTDFALNGISLGYRVDGRAFGQRRPLSFDFGTKDSSVVVRLGSTVVTACVAARIEPPMHSRGNEGSLRCIVRDATFLSGRKQSGEQREVLQLYERFLDRSFKESKAVDLESLCIQAGKHVWYIELQLTVLNDDGNVLDALGWAGLAALRVFKREEVERGADVTGGQEGQGGQGALGGQTNKTAIRVYSLDEREGVGMTLHHFPVAVTFVVCNMARTGNEEGERTAVLVDPTAVEEVAASGSMTISVTPQGELCAVQKADGCGMGANEVFGCMRRGMELAKEGCEVLDRALKTHAVDRVAARVKKHEAHRSEVQTQATARDVSNRNEEIPDEVRRAIEASNVPDEEDNECGDDVEEAATREGTLTGGPVVDPLIKEKGPKKKKKKIGRRYADGKASSGGKEVYKQASDAVHRQAAMGGADRDVKSLRDALK